jgi:hypothetical protein
LHDIISSADPETTINAFSSTAIANMHNKSNSKQITNWLLLDTDIQISALLRQPRIDSHSSKRDFTMVHHEILIIPPKVVGWNQKRIPNRRKRP